MKEDLIYKMLFSEQKVELSSEKVELGLAQDLAKFNKKLQSSLSKADKSWRAYQNYLTGADKPFNTMIDAYEALTDVYADVNTTLSKLSKAAKDLGVSISSLEGYEVAQKNLQTADDILKTINSFDDPSKFQ